MPLKRIEGSTGINTRDVFVGPIGASDWGDTRSEASVGGLGGANMITSGAFKTSCEIHASFLALGGGLYRIRRQLATIDFSTVIPRIPQGVRVVKLQLGISETASSSNTLSDTHGDKIRVGHLFNPTTPGTIETGDFDIARHDLTSFSDALQIANNTNNQIFDISNKKLMNQMQKAINNKSVIHLSFLNELDYSNIEPTAGQNIVKSGTLHKLGAGSMFLRVFYRTNSSRFQQGRGAFAGTDIRNSTGKGFGTF